MYSYTKTSLFTSIKLVATLIWSGGRVGSCVLLDFLAQLSTLHVRHIFLRIMKSLLKTIAHTLSMSTSRKARQNKGDDPASLKSGKLVKAFSITDAVKLVSIGNIQCVKVDVVEGVLSSIHVAFSYNCSFFLHKFCTAIIFTGTAQQTVPPSGASCLLP
jgi:hypothetical protein